MNITVFGASGGIGAHAVALAAERGHQVRAIYRTTPQDPPPGPAEILVGPDIFDPGFAAEAIRGADVVITAVGPNFATRHNPRTAMTSPPDLHQRLARTLIAAMKDRAAPARLISVSTASMGPADNVMGAGPRLLFRFFRTVVAPNLGRVGKDLRRWKNELATSGLDWYALRPVKLTDGPLTRNVQASDPLRHEDHLPRRRRLAHPQPRRRPRPRPVTHPVIITGAARNRARPRPGIQTSLPGKHSPVR